MLDTTQVRADVIDPATGKQETTNVFHFVFVCNEKPLRPLLPETYEEAMNYIDAMRRHFDGKDITKKEAEAREEQRKLASKL